MNHDRIWYIFIDPATGGYSASRVGLVAINLITVVAALWMLVIGRDPTILLTGVAATDATVYAVSTHKGGGG